jgi:type III secretory pathway component EscS
MVQSAREPIGPVKRVAAIIIIWNVGTILASISTVIGLVVAIMQAIASTQESQASAWEKVVAGLGLAAVLFGMGTLLNYFCKPNV